jgi:hypothetical protein
MSVEMMGQHPKVAPAAPPKPPYVGPPIYGPGRDEVSFSATMTQLANIWGQLFASVMDVDDSLSTLTADDLAYIWGDGSPTQTQTDKATSGLAFLTALHDWVMAGQSGSTPGDMPDLGVLSRPWRSTAVFPAIR